MRLFLLLVSLVTLLASPLLAIFPFSFFASNIGGGSSIMVSPNWGGASCNSSSSCVAVSASRTLNVPAGTGIVRLFIALGHACTYAQNGGSDTSFSSGDTLSVADGDNLAFRITGIAAGDIDTVTVNDSGTGASVGDFTGNNTASPP